MKLRKLQIKELELIIKIFDVLNFEGSNTITHLRQALSSKYSYLYRGGGLSSKFKDMIDRVTKGEAAGKSVYVQKTRINETIEGIKSRINEIKKHLSKTEEK